MSNVPIHLAFPDRALSYACATCDQRCCKTGSLSLFPQERARLALLHPALELVAPISSDGVGHYATPCSGCWFLRDAHCTLADGPARPLACSLYPWTLFGMHHDTLVVAPHPLCPLSVTPGNGTSHAEVSELLARLGAAGSPPTPVRSNDGAGALMLERVIREAARATLTDLRPTALTAFTSLATRAYLDGDLRALRVNDVDDVIAEHEARLTAWARALDVTLPPEPSFAAMTPVLNAWTPSLRLFAFEEVRLAQLPDVFLALSLYLAHWHALRPNAAPTPQTVTQIAHAMLPRILELTHARDAA